MSEAFIRYEKDKLIAETKSKMSLDDLFSQIQEDNPAEEESMAKECILYIYLKDKLAEGNIGKLYREVEMPLIGTLAKMELTGVKIDTLQLKDLSKNLTQQMNQIEAKAKDLAGRFIKNFVKYESNEAGKALVAAGPQL